MSESWPASYRPRQLVTQREFPPPLPSSLPTSHSRIQYPRPVDKSHHTHIHPSQGTSSENPVPDVQMHDPHDDDDNDDANVHPHPHPNANAHSHRSSPHTNTVPIPGVSRFGIDTSLAGVNAIRSPIARALAQERRTCKSFNGEVVWPPKVEAALIEALETLLPSALSNCVSKANLFPDRNKFCANYIKQRTGLYRTARQVGSRIQMLRGKWRGSELFQLVALPRELEGATSSGQEQDSPIEYHSVPSQPHSGGGGYAYTYPLDLSISPGAGPGTSAITGHVHGSGLHPTHLGNGNGKRPKIPPIRTGTFLPPPLDSHTHALYQARSPGFGGGCVSATSTSTTASVSSTGGGVRGMDMSEDEERERDLDVDLELELELELDEGSFGRISGHGHGHGRGSGHVGWYGSSTAPGPAPGHGHILPQDGMVVPTGYHPPHPHPHAPHPHIHAQHPHQHQHQHVQAHANPEPMNVGTYPQLLCWTGVRESRDLPPIIGGPAPSHAGGGGGRGGRSPLSALSLSPSIDGGSPFRDGGYESGGLVANSNSHAFLHGHGHGHGQSGGEGYDEDSCGDMGNLVLPPLMNLSHAQVQEGVYESGSYAHEHKQEHEQQVALNSHSQSQSQSQSHSHSHSHSQHQHPHQTHVQNRTQQRYFTVRMELPILTSASTSLSTTQGLSPSSASGGAGRELDMGLEVGMDMDMDVAHSHSHSHSTKPQPSSLSTSTSTKSSPLIAPLSHPHQSQSQSQSQAQAQAHTNAHAHHQSQLYTPNPNHNPPFSTTAQFSSPTPLFEYCRSRVYYDGVYQGEEIGWVRLMSTSRVEEGGEEDAKVQVQTQTQTQGQGQGQVGSGVVGVGVGVGAIPTLQVQTQAVGGHEMGNYVTEVVPRWLGRIVSAGYDMYRYQVTQEIYPSYPFYAFSNYGSHIPALQGGMHSTPDSITSSASASALIPRMGMGMQFSHHQHQQQQLSMETIVGIMDNVTPDIVMDYRFEARRHGQGIGQGSVGYGLSTHSQSQSSSSQNQTLGIEDVPSATPHVRGHPNPPPAPNPHSQSLHSMHIPGFEPIPHPLPLPSAVSSISNEGGSLGMYDIPPLSMPVLPLLEHKPLAQVPSSRWKEHEMGARKEEEEEAAIGLTTMAISGSNGSAPASNNGSIGSNPKRSAAITQGPKEEPIMGSLSPDDDEKYGASVSAGLESHHEEYRNGTTPSSPSHPFHPNMDTLLNGYHHDSSASAVTGTGTDRPLFRIPSLSPHIQTLHTSDHHQTQTRSQPQAPRRYAEEPLMGSLTPPPSLSHHSLLPSHQLSLRWGVPPRCMNA